MRLQVMGRVRLTNEMLDGLRRVARAKETTISDTLRSGMSDYIEGTKTLTSKQKPTRQTAFTCPPETLTRFADLASAAGLTLDDALRDVVAHIINTGAESNGK